ncbi:hypothetical protein [Pleionea sediminis]|uniref:hypothetical protein n=1 Tax=Pleionea sediminis TaxID=2569479 RepID=UPI0011849115|nr:hypothetical protein [Pleionea sediminis]
MPDWVLQEVALFLRDIGITLTTHHLSSNVIAVTIEGEHQFELSYDPQSEQMSAVMMCQILPVEEQTLAICGINFEQRIEPMKISAHLFQGKPVFRKFIERHDISFTHINLVYDRMNRLKGHLVSL